jgi:hypothetical protein
LCQKQRPIYPEGKPRLSGFASGVSMCFGLDVVFSQEKRHSQTLSSSQ